MAHDCVKLMYCCICNSGEHLARSCPFSWYRAPSRSPSTEILASSDPRPGEMPAQEENLINLDEAVNTPPEATPADVTPADVTPADVTPADPSPARADNPPVPPVNIPDVSDVNIPDVSDVNIPDVSDVNLPDVTDVSPATSVINDENDVNMAEESEELPVLDSQGLLVQHPPVAELAPRPEGPIASTDFSEVPSNTPDVSAELVASAGTDPNHHLVPAGQSAEPPPAPPPSKPTKKPLTGRRRPAPTPAPLVALEQRKTRPTRPGVSSKKGKKTQDSATQEVPAVPLPDLEPMDESSPSRKRKDPPPS